MMQNLNGDGPEFNLEENKNLANTEMSEEIKPETSRKKAGKNGDDGVSRIETKKKNKRKETIGWIISLSAAVVLALLLRFFVFEFIIVDGPSMNDTLWTGNVVMVEKVSYKFSPPTRFDIIVCYLPDNTRVVKRVIGLPGDKIQVKEGKCFLNGQAIEESYIKEPIKRDFAEATVPDNSVFVMGDNRNDSEDSRYEGAIPYERILGRGVFLVWPLDKIGAIASK